MNSKITKLIGVFLVFIGIGYLGNELNFWNFSIFFNGWWACILVLLGIGSILDEGINGWNTLLTLAGIYFFLQVNHFIHFRITFGMLVSVGLIVLGASILFSRSHVHVDYEPTSTNSSSFVNEEVVVEEVKEETTTEYENKEEFVEDMKEENVNFTTSNTTNEEKRIFINANFGTKRIVEEGIINKCHIESLFGTVLLDLSKADLRTLEFLSIENIFGTVEILMPAEANIKLTKTNVFSGAHVDSSISVNGYDIHVRGSSIFGTIRINKMK